MPTERLVRGDGCGCCRDSTRSDSSCFAQNAGRWPPTPSWIRWRPGRFPAPFDDAVGSHGFGGSVADQAYGYLFPMGPFFLLGKLVSPPPWVIQRSWESALLIVAFLGVRRLARLLGPPGFWPRVASGLAYALAPRMLTELFSISAELLPVAVLPLVLVPLVRGQHRRQPPAGGDSARAWRCCWPEASTPRRRWRSCRCWCCGCSVAAVAPRAGPR